MFAQLLEGSESDDDFSLPVVKSEEKSRTTVHHHCVIESTESESSEVDPPEVIAKSRNTFKPTVSSVQCVDKGESSKAKEGSSLLESKGKATYTFAGEGSTYR